MRSKIADVFLMKQAKGCWACPKRQKRWEVLTGDYAYCKLEERRIHELGNFVNGFPEKCKRSRYIAFMEKEVM